MLEKPVITLVGYLIFPKNGQIFKKQDAFLTSVQTAELRCYFNFSTQRKTRNLRGHWQFFCL